MRSQSMLGKIAVLLVVLGTATSVALAMADRQVWPRSAWHQDHYRAVAQYLRDHTGSQARVFVWGNSPEIYLYAHRRMGARYMSVNYQTGHVWGTSANDLGGRPDRRNVPAETWKHLMADLQTNLPEFIVDAAAGKLDKMDDEPLTRHPRMAAFVARYYRLDATVLGVPIYRRCKGPGNSAANDPTTAKETACKTALSASCARVPARGVVDVASFGRDPGRWLRNSPRDTGKVPPKWTREGKRAMGFAGRTGGQRWRLARREGVAPFSSRGVDCECQWVHIRAANDRQQKAIGDEKTPTWRHRWIWVHHGEGPYHGLR